MHNEGWINILHWYRLVGLLSHHTVVGYPLRKVMVVSATWVTAHSQVTLDNERNNCRSVQRMIGDFVQFLPHDFVLQARFVKTVKVRNWLSQHLWSAGSDRRFFFTPWGAKSDRYRLRHGSVISNTRGDGSMYSQAYVNSYKRTGVSVAMRRTQQWKVGYGNIVSESHGSLR